MDAGQIERGIQFLDVIENVVGADGCVLNIWTGLALKIESFLEIKRNDGCTCELEQEVAKRADGNLPRNGLAFGRGQAGVAIDDFLLRFAFEHVQQIVCFTPW